MMDTTTAVYRINGTLQGPVMDILGQYLPELKALPREQAYDRTLDDLSLLSRCFDIFRKERPRFRNVIIDERRRPVTEDNVPLSCGRTMAEIVAMIVRTAAKRYFRRMLSPPVRAAAASEAASVTAQPKRSEADELYDAIKAYLLHEWQVPLVPAYADLSPSEVRRVGAKLLDCRDVDALSRLMGHYETPTVVTTSPAPVASTEDVRVKPPQADPRTALLDDILTPDKQRLRAEAFNSTLLDPEVRAALPNVDQILKIGDVLRGVGAGPAVAMVDGLGLRKDQLAVMLMVAQDSIGSTVFGRLFGPRADPELVARIIDRARIRGINSKSDVLDCAIFIRGVFARFGHRSRRD
ncbi:conserved hypothetical protein [Candidatus Terasakiella magnetica]|nr:conserved hypothetical protein [Candidatus Terasakiella magnetica]